MVKSLISKGLAVPHRWEKRYSNFRKILLMPAKDFLDLEENKN